MTKTDTPFGLKADVEAAFRRHMEAAPYAKDLIKRMAFEIVPMITQASAAPVQPLVREHIAKVIDLSIEKCRALPEYAGRPAWESALTSAIIEFMSSPPDATVDHPVGWFNPPNEVHGYQQVAREFEGKPGTIPLYSDPISRAGGR